MCIIYNLGWVCNFGAGDITMQIKVVLLENRAFSIS
jgi:hypothetical protein